MLEIKLVIGKGLELLNTIIYWGEDLESIKLKLSPYFKMYSPQIPDITKIGNRFSQGKLFAQYNFAEINNNCAEGYDFQLGFSSKNELIEFSSVWNFDLKTEFGNVSYCNKFNDLKLEQIDLVDFDYGSILIKNYNIIISKSMHKELYWNEGDLIEYLYIAKYIK